MPHSRSPDHLRSLDGLRGLAILLVVWDHSRGIWPANDRIVSLLLPGFFGVDLFFVLSGFLITRILISERDAGSPITYFLARRFLRICPPYYLLVALLAVCRPGLDCLWAALYVSNFVLPLSPSEPHSPLAHTWSLCVEEHFYLLWPLLVYHLPRRAAAPAMVLTVIIALLSCLLLVPHPWLRELILRGSLMRFGSLAAGGLLAHYETSLRQHRGRSLTASALLLLGSVAVFAAAAYFRPSGWGQFFLVLGGMPWATGAVLATVVSDGRPVGRFLRVRPLTAAGKVSYGLYLYHYPIFFALGELDNPSAAAFVVALLLSILAAVVSYRYLEAPLLRLKDRFRLPKPALPASNKSRAGAAGEVPAEAAMVAP